MPPRVYGLFSWIDSNNKRSLALLGVFMLLFVVLSTPIALIAVIGVFPPLLLHGRWIGALGWIVLLLGLVGMAVFGVQYVLHVRLMRRRIGFRFIDAQDEPRLCRIAEPVLIASGIPVPFFGVIETRALNAFACGVTARHTVIVVTRGLIDGLNDDELGAVLAHEIAHVKNHDTRLMAVANILVDMVSWRYRTRKQSSLRLLLILPMVMVPPLVYLMLGAGLFLQIGHWTTLAVRLAIGSSREFMADAYAVQLTQNPAALVSALYKTQGRSDIAGAAAAYGPMMIDGQSEGAQASHPHIAERVAAITRLTGSMVFTPPSLARDSRPGGGFGRRGAIMGMAPMQELAPAMTAAQLPSERGLIALIRRVAKDSPNTIFGQPAGTNWIIALWFVLLFAVYWPTSTSTEIFLRRAALGMAAEGPLSRAFAGDFYPGCRFRNGGGCTSPPPQMIVRKGQESDRWLADQVAIHRCYATIPLSAPGAPEVTRGQSYWPLSKSDTNVSAEMFAGLGRQAAGDFAMRSQSGQDKAIDLYVHDRRQALTLLSVYYGPAGVAMGQNAFTQPGDSEAIAALGRRLNDPAYRARLSPLDRAEYRLLADHPQDFIPCRARLGHEILATDAPDRTQGR